MKFKKLILQILFHFLHDEVLGNEAHETIDHFFVLDEDEHGDVHHAELHGEVVVFVGVAFADDGLAFKFGGHFFDNRSEVAARSAPGGPEVDHHQFVPVDQGFKIA